MHIPFSVILPETNSPLIDCILNALQAQTIEIAHGEVIVIHSARTLPFNPIDNFQFIPAVEDKGFASDKRNQGIHIARGEILLFLDDDCIPEPDWIERHLDCHANGELVVGGSVKFQEGNYLQTADNLSAFHFMTHYLPPGYRSYLCTANLSVHRSVVEKCGQMVPHRNRAEDLEWTARFQRNGHRLYFEPRACVLHHPNRRDFRSFWRHWWYDAPHTLDVRLRYADQLHTPKLANRRFLYLWASPLIAAWTTFGAFSHPISLRRYGHTLPLVYLSKLIWCWSAFYNFPDTWK
jgi:GT2 family glycosyltransferase